VNTTTAAQQVIDKLDKVLAEPVPKIVAEPLPDTHVVLPGGLQFLKGVATDAEVRELTGEDEEFIAKASGNPGKMLSAILQRGVVSVGDQAADKGMLESLLSGDRDALLLGIRRVTFGDEIYLDATCQHCHEELSVTLSIAKDIPVKSLGDDPRAWLMDLKVGQVMVELPVGSVQRQIQENLDKTGAEVKTIMLRGCVNSINGMPVISDAQVQKLGVRDRQKIVDAINEANPGPLLGAVVANCAFCEKEMSLPLDLVSLFRF
jgi:hypothetical protein